MCPKIMASIAHRINSYAYYLDLLSRWFSRSVIDNFIFSLQVLDSRFGFP